MQEKKKLNTLTLSGMIIGPIFGSGLILLPPLLYNMVQNYSLVIWGVILTLGFMFALIFGKLAIMYPGDGGVSLATKEVLGKKYQLLTSFYLIFAVFFGPVAVLLIAAEFIQSYFPETSLVSLATCIYVLTYALLLVKIDFLGKLMLIVSSAITLVFFIASIDILVHSKVFSFSLPSIEVGELGYAFLLVFWAIVGWEVIGNYSNEVKSSKTLMQGVVISAIVVSLVYILITLAICFGDFSHKEGSFELIWLIEPLFGGLAKPLLASMSMLLCVGTLLLFVGGVARLIHSLEFSNFSSKQLQNGSPIGAINLLSLVYIITLSLVALEYLSLDILVAFADGFFIANALIGLITAIVLFENGFLRSSAVILCIIFFAILLFSNIFILALILTLFFMTYFKKANV